MIVEVSYGKTFAALIVICFIWVVPAIAQVAIHMSFVTCEQFLRSDSERRDIMAAWLSGYINAAKGRKTVDIFGFERNRAIVEKYCMGHKSEALMNAVQMNSR
jgi:HdeA/HdeB family protein